MVVKIKICLVCLVFSLSHYGIAIACNPIPYELLALSSDTEIEQQIQTRNNTNPPELVPMRINSIKTLVNNKVILTGYIYYLNRNTPGGRGVDCRYKFFREPIFINDNYEYLHLDNVETSLTTLKHCSGSDLDFGLNTVDVSKGDTAHSLSLAKTCRVTLEGTLSKEIDPLATKFPCAFGYEKTSKGYICSALPIFGFELKTLLLEKYRLAVDVDFFYSLEKNVPI